MCTGPERASGREYSYAKSIKRDHNKIHIWSSKPRRCICAASTEHKEISMNDESIDAENRANEITNWLNGLKMSVALRICRAYTKKKLSSLKILSMQILKTMRKVIRNNANHEQNDENEEENAAYAEHM